MPNLIATLLFFLAFGNHGIRRARTLETPSFTVRITERCSEYEVGCGDVVYEAVSHAGRKLKLHGEQAMLRCGDGTPCHPVGYQFKNGDVVYFISEDGRLLVKRGRKTLVDEVGKWVGE